MKNLRTKNPKEYWKILNRGGKRNKPNIALGVLFDFFKNLNNAENTNDVTNEPNDIAKEKKRRNYIVHSWTLRKL